MTPAKLRARTQAFAAAVVKFTQSLPETMQASEIGRQLLRAATSVSANYRSAGRARSRAEFVAKLGTVLEEADESEHWLDLLHASGIASGAECDRLRDEAGQLRAIFSQATATARRNRHKRAPRSSDPNIDP